MEMQEAWQALRHRLQNVCHEWGMAIVEYPELLFLTPDKLEGKGHVDFDIQLCENRITVTEIVWLSPARKEPENIEVLWDKVKEAIKEVLRRLGDDWYYFEMPNGGYAAFSNRILDEYESMNPV